ncbi:unnamed protein product [Rotaria socialis]|uniref:F-box domain-containing protein n=1 Tax=Rotaria socialis TaxID=392032 RepID=A0A818HVA5_9BILA|nr:unnamed protein product [Rotaria socialis]CAF4893675.1 unnamed protein product [Rotaria socialis]
MSSVYTFEMLPDEMILKMCSYLRGSDVLYAFLNLRARLNLTITSYCRYVNLMAVPHHQFDYVVSQILPLIGSSIRSFVINGNWEIIISQKAFTLLFTSFISNIFPQIEKLTLKCFTGKRLFTFLDNLTDLSQLVELDIRFLREDVDDTLMRKIFASNNRRLRLVSFDNDSIALNLSEDNHKNISFPNIQELKINLESIQILPCLFTLLPNLHRLHVCVEKSSHEEDGRKLFADLSPLIYLTDFQLRFADFVGMFDTIVNILNQMPFLETLTFDLWTNDERLVNGSNLIPILPSSLKQFHFLIRYYCSESNCRIDHLLKSWPNHMRVSYSLNEDDSCILFYTMPCCLRSTIISAKISKHVVSSWTYMEYVEDLQISDVTCLNDIIPIVKHLHRLHTLAVDAKKQPENATSLTQSIRLRLPWLKKLEVHGICELFHLLQAAPNLEYLIVEHNSIKHLLEDEPTCSLLQKQIVRLEIFRVEAIDTEQLKRIALVFNKIIEFILNIENSRTFIDSIITAALLLWKNKELFSLHIGGLMSAEATENLQEWMVHHSDLTREHSFAIAYQKNWFSLWW